MWFENDAANATVYVIGSSADNYYVGQGEFDPGEDISICKATLYLSQLGGSITGKTFYCQVWTMSGTSLGTLQGESDGVAGVNTWAYDAVDFEFSTSVDLSNGIDYCIVITMKEVDAINYAQTLFTVGGTGLDGSAGRWQASKTRSSWWTASDFKCDVYTD